MMSNQAAGAFLSSMMNSMTQSLHGMGTVLLDDGYEIAAALLVVSTTWILIKWMLSSNGSQALGEFVGVMSRYAFVTVLLTGWVGWLGGYFEAGANDIANRLNSAGVGAVSNLATNDTVLESSISTIMTTAGRLLVSERETENCYVDNDSVASDMGTAAPKPSSCGKKGSMGWADIFSLPGSVLQIVITWLLRLLAVAFLGLMMAALVTVLILAQAMFGISLIVGPIMVPWLIWERTEFLFDGWLRFTIAGFLTKIIAAIMVAMIFSIVFALRTLGDSVINASTVDLISIDEVVAFAICVISAVGAFLMWQVPSLASSLMSGGSTSASGFGKGFIGRRLSGGDPIRNVDGGKGDGKPSPTPAEKK